MKLLYIFLTLCISSSSIAQLSALDIMKKNNEQIKVEDESVTIDMTLINKKGQTRKRSIILTTQTNRKGEQNSLIKFNSPQNVSGTGLLTIEHMDKEDDQWLYLPALKRSRRISAANQTDPFMGTDFTYEDLSTEDINDFTYKLIGEETLDGVDTFKIMSTPIDRDRALNTGYDHRIIWVRKQDYVTAKIDYYNKQKILVKNLVAGNIKAVPSSQVSRAHIVTMKNLKTNHATKLVYGDFSINKGINKKQFSMRSLERSW